MQIKRFEAKTMAEAFNKIKQTLGPDAVILSAKSLKAQAGILKGRSTGVEVMAASDNIVMKPNAAQAYPYVARQYKKTFEPPENKKEPAKSGLLQSIGTKISPFSAIRGGNKKTGLRPDCWTKAYKRVKHCLEANEVDREIQEEILERVMSRSKSGAENSVDNLWDHLAGAFDDMGICYPREGKKRGKQHVTALVGMAGVGKTTSLVKLIANQLLESDLPVGVISLDVHRVASNALLNVYAGIMGFDVEFVSNSDEAKTTLRKLKDKSVVFVDTPGVGLNDNDMTARIKSLLERLNPDEIHLVMHAGIKKSTAESVIKRFEMFDFNRLLFTKIDETTVCGPLINLSIFSDVPISYLTSGQNVPEDIEMISPDKMTELILSRESTFKYRSTRRKTGHPGLIRTGMHQVGYN